MVIDDVRCHHANISWGARIREPLADMCMAVRTRLPSLVLRQHALLRPEMDRWTLFWCHDICISSRSNFWLLSAAAPPADLVNCHEVLGKSAMWRVMPFPFRIVHKS